jgi:hypothetical protein
LLLAVCTVSQGPSSTSADADSSLTGTEAFLPSLALLRPPLFLVEEVVADVSAGVGGWAACEGVLGPLLMLAGLMFPLASLIRSAYEPSALNTDVDAELRGGDWDMLRPGRCS